MQRGTSLDVSYDERDISKVSRFYFYTVFQKNKTPNFGSRPNFVRS